MAGVASKKKIIVHFLIIIVFWDELWVFIDGEHVYHDLMKICVKTMGKSFSFQGTNKKSPSVVFFATRCKRSGNPIETISASFCARFL